METSKFFDTGQRNKFPRDLINLHIPNSDAFKVEIKRGLMFFHVGQKDITLGKLREFFTGHAIQLFEHDGYITIATETYIEQLVNSDEIKKVYTEYISEKFNKEDPDEEFDASEMIKEFLKLNLVQIVDNKVMKLKYGGNNDTYSFHIEEYGEEKKVIVSFK